MTGVSVTVCSNLMLYIFIAMSNAQISLLRDAQFIPHKRDPYISRLTYVAILGEYKHS